MYAAYNYMTVDVVVWACITWLAHWIQCWKLLAMTSLMHGLCSTSDIITSDQNWLYICRRKRSFQWYDQSDQLIRVWNMHENAQKFECQWKTQSKISYNCMCYSLVKKNGRLNDPFLEFFEPEASQVEGQSLLVAKKKQKKKERWKKL